MKGGDVRPVGGAGEGSAVCGDTQSAGASRLVVRDVHAFAVSFPVAQADSVVLGVGRAIKRDAVVVKVTTECGLVGYGESHHGRAHTTVAHLINTALRRLVVGKDASDVIGIWKGRCCTGWASSLRIRVHE
ncbi:hypothetical protein [Cupriavidus sp. YAF13]|uniref:hypothetical protein n=1 Tax=Cupriavidus sp. YAF13 TaxID=3233075 RepID=UPI003F8F3448